MEKFEKEAWRKNLKNIKSLVLVKAMARRREHEGKRYDHPTVIFVSFACGLINIDLSIRTCEVNAGINLRIEETHTGL